MYSRFEVIQKFIRYYFAASNGKGHGIHSPFVFDFVSNVLNDKRNFYAYLQIEDIRSQLLKNEELIEEEDLGAGSSFSKTGKRPVSAIIRSASKSEKFGRLLFRIANYYQPKTMVELGTSAGLSSAYLASALPHSQLITIEGSPAIAGIAKKNFSALGLSNIELMTGNFDDILPTVLGKHATVDLTFIDGNHRKQPTLDYFNALIQHTAENSLLIFDDIHWSDEMEETWEKIKNDERVMLTVDLFFLGIVFFKSDFKTKQHFIIRF